MPLATVPHQPWQPSPASKPLNSQMFAVNSIAAQPAKGTRSWSPPLPPPRARILVIASEKGGVGKSTCTVNLAHALALLGFNVLIIDADPRGDASTALGLPPAPDIYRHLVLGETLASQVIPATRPPAIVDGIETQPALHRPHLTILRGDQYTRRTATILRDEIHAGEKPSDFIQITWQDAAPIPHPKLLIFSPYWPLTAHKNQQLSRVDYEWRLDPKPTWLEVADWMNNERQVLTIVNTKKDAMALLDALNDPTVIHLSTLLCGAHRRSVVEEIKRRLKAGEPCRVVATQVVEAGVDIDFPLVMRAFAPLDSIIQAAGRANRHGLLPNKGRVIVFDPAEGGLPLGNYRVARDTTRTMLSDGPPNMDDPAVVAQYFKLYYPLPDNDQQGIQELRKALNYPEVAQKFRMIEENTISVVVRYAAKQAEIAGLVERLRLHGANRRQLLREIQPYLVSIYKKQAKAYCKQGFISAILADDDGELLLGEWQGEYDAVRGLVVKDLSPDKLIQ